MFTLVRPDPHTASKCTNGAAFKNDLFSYYLDKVCQIEANEILICFSQNSL